MRINIFRNIIIFLFALIAADLFFLQIIRGGYFYRQSRNNSIRLIPFEGARGKILDRNGKVLADSERAWHVVLIPQDIQEVEGLFAFLGGILNERSSVLEGRYTRNKLTPFSPVTVAEGISRPQAIMIEENAYRFPGLMVLEKYQRRYPFAEAFAHVTGYVGKADLRQLRRMAEYGYRPDELVGYSGIEEYYDEQLRGDPGGRQIQVNSRGRQVRLLSVKEASSGQDVVLTLDQRIQGLVTRLLGGARGAGVVLDPETGEILALVSSPSFNPNYFVDKDLRSRVKGYLHDPFSPLLNRAVSASFPPGSAFKISVAIAGLQEKKVTLSTTYDCPGYFKLGNRVFRSPHAYGPQDLRQAMGHSANEYFFHVGLQLGADLIAKYARSFGFGEKTGIDLPYESEGHIPSHRRGWYPGDTANMSIGQGEVLVTPLQLAQMIAVVENKGRVIHPHIVKAVGGTDIIDKKKIRHVSLRDDVWQTMRQILYAPVKMSTGTARVVDLPGMDTYGKTGTAQAGGDKNDHAWFVGVTRTSKRRIAYCFFLEHGGSSANACAMTREFLLSLREQGIL